MNNNKLMVVAIIKNKGRIQRYVIMDKTMSCHEMTPKELINNCNRFKFVNVRLVTDDEGKTTIRGIAPFKLRDFSIETTKIKNTGIKEIINKTIEYIVRDGELKIFIDKLKG